MNKIFYNIIYWTIASVLIAGLAIQFLCTIPIIAAEVLEFSIYHLLTRES